MSWASKADTAGNRRRILAHSRYEETPRQLVLELTADGTDYLVHGDFAADEFTQQWDRLRMVLEDVTGKKTRHELLAVWPLDFPRPSDVTLYRWLQRAVTAGLVCQEGTGRRADPFRYWLPAREAVWLQNPLYALEQDRQQTLRWLDQQLAGR